MSNLLVVKDKVQRYVSELFEHVSLTDDGGLRIPFGSTAIFINIGEVQGEESIAFNKEHDLSQTWIRVYAPVLVMVKPTNELFKWIAIEGQHLDYGGYRFMMDESDGMTVIEFSYSLPGDTLDPGELKNAVLSVLMSSDGQDEELQNKFGGKLFEEFVNEKK
jgi:hypothetical protein